MGEIYLVYERVHNKPYTYYMKVVRAYYKLDDAHEFVKRSFNTNYFVEKLEVI